MWQRICQHWSQLHCKVRNNSVTCITMICGYRSAMQPFQFELLNILLFPPSSTSKGPFLSHIHNTQMTQVSHNLPLWRYKHLYPEIKRITITVSIFVIFTKIIIIHNMFYQTSSRCCFPLLYICAIFFKAVLFFSRQSYFLGHAGIGAGTLSCQKCTWAVFY